MSARQIIETASRSSGGFYRGWQIHGSGDKWGAYRHGVRMNGNSEELVRRMIDLRKEAGDPYTYIDPTPIPDRNACPTCQQQATSRCRCSGPHTLESLNLGHGMKCANGHRWSYDEDGQPLILS